MALATKFLGKTFPNPLVLASGIFPFASALLRAFTAGAAAVTTKSTSLEPRQGYPAPNLAKYSCGYLNCIGLRNKGVEAAIEEIKILKQHGLVIASIVAKNMEDFGQMAKEISQAEPDFLEVNISCPNVEDEFGRPFAADPDKAAAVTRLVKENTSLPIVVKLSPNVIDIKPIAKAVEEAGAEAICAINSLGPGMLINLKTRKPVLSNKVGGITGPAILPLALRCVFDIYRTVKIPILGMGGVTSAEDALQMLMAGASLVGIGSAVYLYGTKVFQEINQGLEKFLQENNYQSLREIIGLAHDKST